MVSGPETFRNSGLFLAGNNYRIAQGFQNLLALVRGNSDFGITILAARKAQGN
jgi:hypothetical protein